MLMESYGTMITGNSQGTCADMASSLTSHRYPVKGNAFVLDPLIHPATPAVHSNIAEQVTSHRVMSASPRSGDEVISKKVRFVAVHSLLNKPGIDEAAWQAEAGSVLLSHLGIIVSIRHSTTSPTIESGTAQSPLAGSHSAVRISAIATSAIPTLPLGIHTGANTVGDPVLELLALAQQETQDTGHSHERLKAEALCLAMIVRVACTQQHTPSGQESESALPSRPKCGLATWRLQRVIALIDADITAPLKLADLAAAAGLSRMHFAAQFRLATGVTAHHYLLLKRIGRAKELMRETDKPIVQVALQVGFQNQAHFTTVFRRFVNATPSRWRSSYAETKGSPCYKKRRKPVMGCMSAPHRNGEAAPASFQSPI